MSRSLRHPVLTLVLAVVAALPLLGLGGAPAARADVSGETRKYASDARGDVRDLRGDARSVSIRTGAPYTAEFRWYAAPQPAAGIFAQVYFRSARSGAPTWQVFAEWDGSWDAGIYRSGDSSERCNAKAVWFDSNRGVRFTFARRCVNGVTPATVSGQSVVQLQSATYQDKVNR